MREDGAGDTDPDGDALTINFIRALRFDTEFTVFVFMENCSCATVAGLTGTAIDFEVASAAVAGALLCTASDGMSVVAEFMQTPAFAQLGEVETLASENFGSVGLPEGFSLAQNHPNPFNLTTVISFSVPEAGEVTLSIYNMRGQLVQTVVSGFIAAGEHSRVWNGRDFRGAKVASGVTFTSSKPKGLWRPES